MTDRNLTSGMATAVASGLLRPAIFYEGEYVSGGASAFLRLWTGVGNYVWNTFTWTGGGQLLGITALEETGELKAAGFTVSLSGMPSALIALALASMKKNRSGKLWLGLFDAAGALIVDPYPIRRGRFDVAVIDDNGTDCTISAKYEDRLVDLQRPRERRYTTEDQAIDYPGDKGFEFVETLQDAKFVWGR